MKKLALSLMLVALGMVSFAGCAGESAPPMPADEEQGAAYDDSSDAPVDEEVVEEVVEEEVAPTE